MTRTAPEILAALNANVATLSRIRRGIEKESLRINADGELAKTPHPTALGSALTHPEITTDFSEALLEFITPVSTDIDTTLKQLDNIHRWTYANLGDELLWPGSMPCLLGPDDEIPVAQYGSSNVARMKTLYRLGLGQRYGRRMQTISGIHYNFSVPDELWQWLAEASGRELNQDFITERYFGLIRNFRRLSWLLIYLFGAAPAVCRCFLDGKEHKLDSLNGGTLYHPFGTSLRMGDFGYQSAAQSPLNICYNTLDNYIQTLKQAIQTPHPDYARIPKTEQLSGGLLQIENEFYSPIRPKRVTQSGEIPLGALKRGGVEYIEVRCVDVNPESPLGITREQIQFLDVFLVYCLLSDSPLCNEKVYAEIGANLHKVVEQGREPGLTLNDHGQAITLGDWAQRIFDDMADVAEAFDTAIESGEHPSYLQVLADWKRSLSEPDNTPSAKMIDTLRQRGLSYYAYMMERAEAHRDWFSKPALSDSQIAAAKATSATSLSEQKVVEESDSLSFDDYLSKYYSQYDTL
ncbi:glutamate--cysteine ligase [Litorivivens lipolytica]|uniref:Glutamate--cysteine ligase n=1 Tax=Litorivivens lipolytica TaxID=1524264 RepID=A0A7W4Z7X6_9GAMM|nr:glutamate--cysteine ligase [Litorivivens lipolytica]MBB3048470.1 glutamate--cysteine ligase [Litorivivens lipolytica]